MISPFSPIIKSAFDGSNLKYNKSLYGGPGTVRKIISVLKKTQFEKLIKDKKFYDLNN